MSKEETTALSALKLALEALSPWAGWADANHTEQYAAYHAIREALAEQPHEPKKFNPNESFEREEAAVARVREFMRNH